MGRQLDRVTGDIKKQCGIFHRVSSDAITVAVVGVNFSDAYRSYEGDRHYDSSPVEEASHTVVKIANDAEMHEMYDEVLVLPYTATNSTPFPFAWKNWSQTSAEYNAALVRISNEYGRRFP